MNIRLLVILIVAMALRMALWVAASVNPSGVFTPDSAGYRQAAQNLAARGEFATDHAPEIFRTPGYPVFLLAGEAAGQGADDRTAWRVTLVMQVLLDVLGVLVVYWLAAWVAGQRAALLAAALQAISAAAIAYSCRILSDSVYAFLFTLALLMMVGHLRTGLRWPLALAAALLAAAAYVRPVGIVMAAVFAAVILVRCGRMRNLAVFAGVFMACMAPWVVRNALAADYVGFSSFAGDTAYGFYAPEVLARSQGIDGAAARDALAAEDAAYIQQNHPTPGQAARRRAQRAREIILSHPWPYARLHLAGSGGVFLPAATDVLEVAGITAGGRGTLEVLKTQGLVAAAMHYFGGQAWPAALAAAMLAGLLIKYLAVIACGAGALRRKVPAEAWLMAMIVVVSVLLAGPFGLPRYRVPLEPILNIAAAGGLVMIWDRLRRRRKPVAGPATA